MYTSSLAGEGLNMTTSANENRSQYNTDNKSHSNGASPDSDPFDFVDDIPVEEDIDYDTQTREYCYEYLFKAQVDKNRLSLGGYEDAVIQFEQWITKKHIPIEGIIRGIKTDIRTKHLFEDEPLQEDNEESEAPQLNFTLPSVNLDNSTCTNLRAQFLAFARDLSPESSDWFLEAAFWWVCSVIAMRRIAIDFAEPMYTNLYIALCAKSSVWKKSTARRPIRRILKGLSLGHLLHEGSDTPEAFVQDASGKFIPQEWEELDEKEQTTILQELATAGLQTLFIDELGQFLVQTRNANGTMGLWRRIILEWYECPEDWAKRTKGGGKEIVDKAYFSMFGGIIPDIMNEKDMESLLTDGGMARFLCISSKDGTGSEVHSFEPGYLPTPPNLLATFAEWHKRLKIPQVDIFMETKTIDDKRAKEGKRYTTKPVKIWTQPLGETTIKLSPEAHKLWHNFRVAIQQCRVDNNLPSIINSYYDRLSTDFVKIAAIAASIEDSESIEVSHLAIAFPIIEEARLGIHRLLAQAGRTNGEQEDDYEEKKAKREKEILSEIREYFKLNKNKKDFSIPVLINRRPKLEKIAITTLTQTVEDLTRSQFLLKETKEHPVNKRRTTVYKLNA
jgi:hypothetical protein